MTADASRPPMDPNTDEASPAQLHAARAQGEAYGRTLALMTRVIAEDGGQPRAGTTSVGYAVEKAVIVGTALPPRAQRPAVHEPVDVEFTGVRVQRGRG